MEFIISNEQQSQCHQHHQQRGLSNRGVAHQGVEEIKSSFDNTPITVIKPIMSLKIYYDTMLCIWTRTIQTMILNEWQSLAPSPTRINCCYRPWINKGAFNDSKGPYINHRGALDQPLGPTRQQQVCLINQCSINCPRHCPLCILLLALLVSFD